MLYKCTTFISSKSDVYENYLEIALRLAESGLLFPLFSFCFSIIVSVRETCADWHFGVEPLGDPALKGKKDPDNGFGIKVPRRNVGQFTIKILYITFYFSISIFNF